MSGDLSALVARLEAVTTRLESAADKASGGGQEGMSSCGKKEDLIIHTTAVVVSLSIFIF